MVMKFSIVANSDRVGGNSQLILLQRFTRAIRKTLERDPEGEKRAHGDVRRQWWEWHWNPNRIPG
jgi:hypothetical protein